MPRRRNVNYLCHWQMCGILFLTKSFGSFKLNFSISDGILPISTHNVRVEMAWPGFMSHKANNAFDLRRPSAVSSSPFDINAVTTKQTKIAWLSANSSENKCKYWSHLLWNNPACWPQSSIWLCFHCWHKVTFQWPPEYWKVMEAQPMQCIWCVWFPPNKCHCRTARTVSGYFHLCRVWHSTGSVRRSATECKTIPIKWCAPFA